jgi:hypothetical protein
VTEPFYKVVFEAALAGANPLRLRNPDLANLKPGDEIPVLVSFERRPHLEELIGSVDDFAKLADDRKQAMIEALRRHRPTHAVGQIARIEADSEPDCLGLLVVREPASG